MPEECSLLVKNTALEHCLRDGFGSQEQSNLGFRFHIWGNSVYQIGRFKYPAGMGGFPFSEITCGKPNTDLGNMNFDMYILKPCFFGNRTCSMFTRVLERTCLGEIASVSAPLQ